MKDGLIRSSKVHGIQAIDVRSVEAMFAAGAQKWPHADSARRLAGRATPGVTKLGGMSCRPRQWGAARYRRLFAYAECTRAILNALRDAPEPKTTVVERVALDCRIATEAPDVAATLVVRVRAALVKLGKRGIVTGDRTPARWSVGQDRTIHALRQLRPRGLWTKLDNTSSPKASLAAYTRRTWGQ
jgi:hypothetical protein